MIWYRVFCVIAVASTTSYFTNGAEFKELDKNCNNIQCKIINNYINRFNKYEDSCNNAYSNMCKEDQTTYRKKLLEDGKDMINKPIQLHKSILNYLEVSTSNESDANELKSVIIERKLFQECMKLGDDQNSMGANLTKSSINSLMSKFSEMMRKDTWQNIDQEMYSLGFGHSFFEISVMKNPENPNRNIILLQPPYVSSMLFGRLRDILHGFTLREENENEELLQIQQFIEFLAVIYANNANNEEYDKSLNEMLSLKKWNELYNLSYRNLGSLKMNYTKILDDGTNSSSAGEPNSLTEKGLSIFKLYAAMSSSSPNYIIRNFIASRNFTYNEAESDVKTAEIKWIDVFNKTFSEVNVNIYKDELIFVKNKPFFINLGKLLAATPNNIIAGYVVHKFKYKHLRYTDWNQVQSMEDSLNKLQFCNFETKLYGTSYKLLRSWEKNQNITKRRKEIISNIVDVTKSKILKLPTLSETKKNYLLSQVDAITKNLLYNRWNKTIISNFYGDFYMTESYFTNIIQYRRILKHKELSSLMVASDSTSGFPVFSLVDSADLQGQFILNMYLEDIKIQNETDRLWLESFPGLPKEVQYGDYGVKVASYLYLLLNQNVLDRGGISTMVSYFKIQHLTYSHEILACFDPNYRKKIHEDFFSDIFRSFFPYWYSINEIVQTFGLSVAYEAMQKDNFNEIVPNELTVTPDQLFFLTYIQSQCADLSTHVNRILSSSNEYRTAFQCFDSSNANKNNKCRMTLFDIKI